jgi:hypothetical protein
MLNTTGSGMRLRQSYRFILLAKTDQPVGISLRQLPSIVFP